MREGVDLDGALEVVERAVAEATVDGRPPVLAGYSMGGRIALHYALSAAASIRGLILESASPGMEGTEERAARRAWDAEWAAVLRREGIAAFVDRWEALPLFEGVRRLPEAERNALRQRRLAADPEGLSSALEGLGTGVLPSVREALSGLDVPTLLIVGQADEKYVRMARDMVALLPRARSVVVPRSGHVVHLEAPERWVDEVSGFVATAGS